MAQCPNCGSLTVGVARMERGYQLTCTCGFAGNVPSLPHALKKAALEGKVADEPEPPIENVTVEDNVETVDESDVIINDNDSFASDFPADAELEDDE